MHGSSRNKVKLSSIVESQLPLFAREDYPFFVEFLQQYYEYLENPGQAYDLLTNPDSYTRLDFVADSISTTELTQDLGAFDDVVYVTSTKGYPFENGMLKIDDEIIYYKSKTETSFEECIRGFSGVTSYTVFDKTDVLEFSETTIDDHLSGALVNNLNALLLDEFFTKLKIQFAPGFEDVTFTEKLNRSLFIKQIKDFYSTKGGDDSFNILFKALYGTTAKIIRPRDFLIKPSSADYRKTLDLVVEEISGDPSQILNRVLYQEKDGDIPTSYGTVVGVKNIEKNGNDYYVISLDYGYNRDLSTQGTVFGEFSLHSQTQTLESVSIGSSTITVDSTVGFAAEGELLVLFNGDEDAGIQDTFMLVNYNGVNLNQFLNVTGVTKPIESGWTIGVNSYVYSYDNEEKEVRMRVSGVLGEIKEIRSSSFSEIGDYAKVWTLGKETDDIRTTEWMYNHAISNRVFELSDEGNLNYSITTYDKCRINGGESVLVNCDVRNLDGSLERIEKVFEVFSGPTPDNSFRIINDREIVEAYYVKRFITKAKNTEFIANVQNTYVDLENSVYVATNSLPNYFNDDLELNYRDVIIKGTFVNSTIITSNKHGFYTGDAVWYDSSFSEENTLDLVGYYFIFKIDDDSFRLSKSRSNLESQFFVTFNGFADFAKLVRISNIGASNQQLKLSPQYAIRKIRDQKNYTIDEVDYEILPQERVGIFKNGVEIISYKSKDACFYGEIEEVVVNSGGEGYDVINPPELSVIDSSGSNFSGNVCVRGLLQRVNVTYPGIDYIKIDSIIISGGNPTKAAEVEPILQSVNHVVTFRSDLSTKVSLSDGSIISENPHNFRDDDEVIYSSQGQTALGGLVDGNVYYINPINTTKFTLHESPFDAAAGINTVGITTRGVGNHIFTSTAPKFSLRRVEITQPGEGYRNNVVTVTSSGISTSAYSISKSNHLFNNGDEVVYQYTGSEPIAGLSTSSTYYVIKTTDNSFSLYEKNTDLSLGGSDYYAKLGRIVELGSAPSGYHIFKDVPITIEINGILDVSRKVENTAKAKIDPIFRGEVIRVDVVDGGSNYGSENVINSERQPNYSILTGDGAVLNPIIFDGRLENVVVVSGGTNYNATPDIELFQLNEQGNRFRTSSAEISPIVSGGKISGVYINGKGNNYGSNPSVVINSPGVGAQLQFKIKKWTFDQVARLIDEQSITSDDGYLVRSIDKDFEMQYTHIYPPRKLRNLCYAKKFEEGVQKYRTDLNNDFASDPYHSPIIGWAYDGSPIYGPYGYDTPEGGQVRRMTSGYELEEQDNRPNFKLGLFINDYQFRGNGDLDRNNGRFCITPEFPNGVYAYFMTIGEIVQAEGQFSQNKLPAFPYIVGDDFEYTPILFNYNTAKDTNQVEFDFQEYGCRRNVTPYNLKQWYSGYEYLIQPNQFDAHFSKITDLSAGSVDDIDVLDSGDNYKVKDPISFVDNVGTGGTGAVAFVSEIKGKTITSLAVTETYIPVAQGYQVANGKTIIFCEQEHGLTNDNFVDVVGVSTASAIAVDTQAAVIVENKIFTLTRDIADAATTGPVIYFPIKENNVSVYPNDIFIINDEKMKILNIDKKNSRLRVLREHDGTVGSAHSLENKATILPTHFKISLNLGDFSTVNREIYFNPEETVGIGTTAGTGITTNLYFNNPGSGATYLNIPTRALYFPGHGIQTNDELIYYSNTGDPLAVSTTGIGSTHLSDGQSLFAVRLTKDLIGISTNEIGISTITKPGYDQSYVGVAGTDIDVDLLYFVGLGTGENHSFKTAFEFMPLEVSKSRVTVSTAETHGMEVGDKFRIFIRPGGVEEFDVYYNDATKRTLVNQVFIPSAGINTSTNEITVEDHGFEDGDKVLVQFTDTPDLLKDKFYFTEYVSRNKFNLYEYYDQAVGLGTTTIISNLGNTIRFSTAGNVFLRTVHPKLKVNRDKTIRFNLGDSSLSYVDGTTQLTAFDFKIYTDSSYQNEYITDQFGNFVVKQTGRIGVDNDAKVEITVNGLTPRFLYYVLSPKEVKGISELKSGSIVDSYRVQNPGQIEITEQGLSGGHVVVSTSTSSFVYDSPRSYPGITSFTSTDSSLNYVTRSINATGPIHDVYVANGGFGYKSIVGIVTVATETGSGAKVRIVTDSIGGKKVFKTEDVGWDYPTDVTLKPTAKLPDVLILDQKLSFDTITRETSGINYTVAPDLIVKDTASNKVLTDLILKYELSGSVFIVKNTNELSNNTPQIIPTNNSNGFSIKSLTFDNSTKIATLTFKTSFSAGFDFPFEVGKKVLIEGCASKTLGSSGRSFNSSDFEYSLYKITEIDPNFGGSLGSIKFDMSPVVGSVETLGEYDDISATGIVVPEVYFPTFVVKTKRNEFIPGEIITGRTTGSKGEVQRYDSGSEVLKYFGQQTFELNEDVEGAKSGTVGKINDIQLTELYYDIRSSAIITKEWTDTKGFLNYNEYKIHDSDYYQHFSYSIQSTVSENIWEDEVGRLNHLVGWKRFSDYSIESRDLSYTGISTSQDGGDFVSVADFSRVVNTNCVYDFDIVVDETTLIGSKRFSTGMVFNSRELQDFNKSVGNRVLIIDDISDQFNSEPRSDRFSVIDNFKLADSRARKYIVFSRDSRFTGERQVYIVTTIHDDNNFYVNQYGRVETVGDLGSFDFSIFEDEGQFKFYPNKYLVNDYDLSFVTYNIDDYTSGIGSTVFGNVATVYLENSSVSSGATTTIATIPLDYRSSKLLVQVEVEDSTQVYEFDEISVIHDGSDVTIQDYGQLTTTLTEYSTDGIGTYNAYIDGSNIKVDLIPNVLLNADVNVMRVSLASSESGFTTPGETNMSTTLIESTFTSIASTESTGGNIIASYDNGITGINDYSSGYYIVSIDDNTNQKYQLSEVVVASTATTAYYTEFGQLFTDSEVGIVTAGVAGTVTNIYFTAGSSIDAEVRVYAHHIGIRDLSNDVTEINLTNGEILTGNSEYIGTQNEIKRDFELFHKGNPIFQKEFDGSNIAITSVTENTIELPQHFFVTGEEVIYSYDSTNEPIGIATTTIPGIGSTDKLPSSLFIIKEDELLVKVAASATDALALRPTPLDIISVGVGSEHYITAKNQNPKSLVTIDNMIQSPIVSTATTTSLLNGFTTVEDVLTIVSEPEKFFTGDFLQINDEIVRVTIVGYGGSDNDIYVQRAVLGTKLANHGQYDLMTKIIGNYNIVDNTISFADAPYGKTPVGLPDNRPDQRDYTGITTFSRFSGRTFMRNADVDTTNDPYYKNYVFDGIEDQFTGIQSSFELKVGGQSIDGISASNAIITVNDLFQSPKVDQSNVDIEGNYTLEESGGSTNIIFDESEYDREDDIIIKGLPVGGRIVSVGSTKGFGYQSLVSAAGTATVSSAGTISAINISNVGGGYRTGIQTNIEVYIREETVESSSKVAIGTALVTRGRVTGVAVTNSDVFYVPRDISTVGHTTTTGLTTVTTSTAHGLSVGNEVVLSGVGEIINSPIIEYLSVRAVNSGTEFEVNTGVTTDSYSYSSGGKVEKYFTVDFDDPLPYDNLATTYSTTSIGDTGGRAAKVSVVVGEGSSVTDFEIKNVGYGYEINNVLTVSVGGTDGIPYMYHGRFADAGNLLAYNRQFLIKEAVGYATATYPSLLSNPDYDETKCERDTGYIVDALANDLFFGGNFNSVAAGNKYWNGPLNYVTGETTETIATYDYLAGISTYVINNQILPVSYQGIAVSVTQYTDTTIDYDTDCSPSYSVDCCSDVASSIYNLVGIITTIIGDGSAYAPVIESPSAEPTLTLPTTLDFNEFNFYITKTETDQFTGWTIGDLDVIDDISDQFNGEKTRFAIKFNGVRTSIKAGKGSLIDVQATLLVFINDVLQVPGEAYLFPGGSTIRFTEAPALGDSCKILFYKGTGDIDVEFVDILETVSAGDLLTMLSDEPDLDQTDRSVKEVTSTDSVDTFLYGGVGISDDPFIERSVNWCRATSDAIIDGQEITKDRDIYEASILPLTTLIYDVGAASTQIWIEGVKTFFDNQKENTTDLYVSTVDIIDQDDTSEALATASVTAGIVTQITVTNTGSGYFKIPTISIGKPVEDGGDQATASAAIASGQLTTITVSAGGTGYDDNHPPAVLISPPTPRSETVFRVDYAGDFGEVIGVGTTTIGAGSSQGLVFEFSIPENSPLKDESIVGSGNTIIYSGIGTGDYFVIRDSIIGISGAGLTSIETDGSDLVDGKDYIDNVYQVHDIATDIPIIVLSDDFIASLTRYGSYSIGFGVSTTVADDATLIIDTNTKVVTVVETYESLGITSFLSRQTFGTFSWGRLDNIVRPYPEVYNIKRDNGVTGINTSPMLRRKNPLKSLNYNV